MKIKKYTTTHGPANRRTDTLAVFLRELHRLGGTTDKKAWRELLSPGFFKSRVNAIEHARAIALSGAKWAKIRGRYSEKVVKVAIKWGPRISVLRSEI